jgi:DNA replication initiation complex subunit (GINS family)
MDEISILTFESIYDLVRKEKTSEEIQKLNPDIYLQLIKYLKTKSEIYRNAKASSSSEEEKIKTQLISARKLIKEFYERRERKILQLAINKSRIKAVDESALLDEEKQILHEITNCLDKYRAGILLNLVNARMPFEHKAPEQKPHEPPAASPEPKPEDALLNVKLRFVSPVPKFLGKNLEVYGPFQDGDETELPAEIAEILINRKRAVKI